MEDDAPTIEDVDENVRDSQSDSDTESVKSDSGAPEDVRDDRKKKMIVVSREVNMENVYSITARMKEMNKRILQLLKELEEDGTYVSHKLYPISELSEKDIKQEYRRIHRSLSGYEDWKQRGGYYIIAVFIKRESV